MSRCRTWCLCARLAVNLGSSRRLLRVSTPAAMNASTALRTTTPTTLVSSPVLSLYTHPRTLSLLSKLVLPCCSHNLPPFLQYFSSDFPTLSLSNTVSTRQQHTHFHAKHLFKYYPTLQPFSPDMDQCLSCDTKTEWSLEGSSGCTHKTLEFFSWQDGFAVVLLVLAALGIVLVLLVGALFLHHHQTPVVKAAGGPFSQIILLSLVGSFVSAVFFVGHPSSLQCKVCTIHTVWETLL